MERQKTVVDASVVLKWFIGGETFSSEAEKVLKRHIEGETFLYAPDLLMYEIGNTLHFRQISPEAVKRAFHDLSDFQIHMEKATNILLLNAIRLAKLYEITVYDAAYAALAEMLGADLVTADNKLAKLPFARHLKDV